ncbi:hypothetical protein PRZ48_010532 [Zasmidium cellare]|uniref:Uncharacterized protein n=1 Tax=Zasmidium cellare TaxID=395010 RepID=A0ABR0E8X9_ZASCE|nr:hypothetical protein PRZ48_010532 [Zasmidium cellare]
MTTTGDTILFSGNGSFYELEKDGSEVRLKKTLNSTELLGVDGGLGTVAYDGKGKGVPTAVIGYDQVIENSLGMSGEMVYLVTGPAGSADVGNATGYFYALRASTDHIEVVYSMKIRFWRWDQA